VNKHLKEYVKKRDFKTTSEPSGLKGKKLAALAGTFVVQEHHASRLHYDFRLEMDGVLKSWAVPKGPSLDPRQKRLAVQVEDHPLEYGSFEGTIPEKQYGAGEVFLWDSGKWEPIGDPHQGLKKGHLDFRLSGKRLHGEWVLVRLKGPSSGKPNWLLMKRSDTFAKKNDAAVKIGSKKKVAPRIWTSSKSPLVEFVSPQLAQLVEVPPTGKEWIHEMKFDGYRTQAIVAPGSVTLLSRNGHDWTSKYPGIETDLKKLDVKSAHLDGEVAFVDEKGRTDFQKLQNALKHERVADLVYYVFDILHLDGKDLRELPLEKRKAILQKVLKGQKKSHLKFSDHIDGQAKDFLKLACSHQFEGIISKRKDGAYISGRTSEWVKAKCTQRQEFVIGGFTEGQGSRTHFGALLLGVYESEKLRYVGKVGTGFDSRSLSAIQTKLNKLEQKKSPFSVSSPRGKGNHWVKPKLVAEIAFANWTEEKILRVPVFHGLREDKSATQIHVEKPAVAKEERESAVTLTHPDKIIFPKEKITKQDIADFYREISQWILPHVSNRPLSLVRCPAGTTKKCFFQRHINENVPDDAIHKVPVREEGDLKNYLAIDSQTGLDALVQRGSFELHAWNCHRDAIDFPDQFILDLDPDDAVPWKRVVEAAFEIKDMLDQLKLKSFVKVSGGKGVHIHVPIEPLYTWDDVKAFTQTLAQKLVEDQPDRYVAKMSKALRKGKIFVDYLRNGYSATAVVPYCLRARPISAVAMPITWDELKKIFSPDQFTLTKALAHLKKRRVDPWKAYFTTKQKISLLKEV